MPNDDITLVSTTDTPEDVQAALTGVPVPAKPVETKPAEVPAPAAPVEPAKPAAVDPAKPTEPPAPEPTAVEKAEAAAKSARERRAERIQSDIDKMIAQRGAARRDVEAEEARLAELSAERQRIQAEIDAVKAGKPAAAAPTTTPAPAAGTTTFTKTRPKLEDVDANGSPVFASYEAWVQADADWSAEKVAHDTSQQIAAIEARIKRELTEAEKQRVETDALRADHARANTGYQGKVEAFKKTTPDFEQVLAASADPVLELKEELGQNALQNIDTYTVRDAENGPAMVYYLAQHPEEMSRIAHLAPALQLAALGRLDERLSHAPAPPPARVATPPVTKAPEPITPVSAAPTASTVSPEDEPYADYKRRRDLEDPQTRDWARKVYGVSA